jgi:VIT1/CCC1 family predicted Fe2+/Mn2+ transporter
MFISYIILGLIPLSPFIFISNTKTAMMLSVIASLTSLLILGLISAKFLKTKAIKSMLRMLILGGLAIGVGLFIGNRFH